MCLKFLKYYKYLPIYNLFDIETQNTLFYNFQVHLGTINDFWNVY